MSKMIVVLIIAFLWACRPLDTRCLQNRFYCLPNEEREIYLSSLPDDELLELAMLDYRTQLPPSSKMVDQMKARGPERSKNLLYRYSVGKVDQTLMDDMVRIFSTEWRVCDEWLANAPGNVKANLARSCKRESELR